MICEGHHRVERGIAVLEHDLHQLAGRFQVVSRMKPTDLLAVDEDLPAGGSTSRMAIIPVVLLPDPTHRQPDDAAFAGFPD